MTEFSGNEMSLPIRQRKVSLLEKLVQCHHYFLSAETGHDLKCIRTKLGIDVPLLWYICITICSSKHTMCTMYTFKYGRSRVYHSGPQSKDDSVLSYYFIHKYITAFNLRHTFLSITATSFYKLYIKSNRMKCAKSCPNQGHREPELLLTHSDNS